MSQLILYGVDPSPPVRAVKMTLAALGVPYEYKVIDVMKGEHLSAEFVKHNPNSTVPALQDGDNWFWDSHAIAAYLVDKYGKDDSLYPKDLVQRAHVEQRLFLDAGILFMSLRNIVKPLYQKKQTHVPEEKVLNVLEGYAYVEKFLKLSDYVAGDQLTIADFSCLSTLVSLQALFPIDAEKYPKLHAWIERMYKLPHNEEINKPGVEMYQNIVKPQLTDIWH